MKAMYVHPFTGFGFYRIFGEVKSNALLVDFLNTLLPDEIETVDRNKVMPLSIYRGPFGRRDQQAVAGCNLSGALRLFKPFTDNNAAAGIFPVAGCRHQFAHFS